MDRKPIGLGFIGCGKHAKKSHCAVLSAGPAANLFAVESLFDTNREAMEQFIPKELQRPNIQIAESVDELLANPLVEAVIIATPPKFHMENLTRCIEAGRHVLVEKPIWVNSGPQDQSEFHVLTEKAKARGLVLTSCHPRRFDRGFITIKEKLENGSLKNFGKILGFNFKFFYHEPPKGWRQNDSLLMDHVNHEIDLLCFVLASRLAGSTFELKKIFDSFDRYEVVGKTLDNIVICFSGSRRLNHKTYHSELEIVFEKGRVLYVSRLVDGFVHQKVMLQDFESGITEQILCGHENATVCFSLLMTNFARSITGQDKNYLTAIDMLRNNISCNDLAHRGNC